MNIIINSGIDYLQSLKKRQEDNSEIKLTVEEIIKEVRKNGDQALKEYTKKFDQVEISNLEVSQEEIDTAMKTIQPDLKEALESAYERIVNFHNIQKRSSQFIDVEGGRVGEIIKPLNKVGIYVPGGKAAYPSSVLMNAVPAKIAGVGEIIMVTPPLKDGSVKKSVLVAAAISGVDRIFKVGGAQSIAGLTYGTESLPAVNKIVGPGNAYVATAKSLVMDKVGIDMIAGPSEILILADETSNPNFIAADMIGQAEHDEKAASMVITTSSDMATSIQDALIEQMKSTKRIDIVNKSIINQGAIIVVPTEVEMFNLANEIAPEHLEIHLSNPDDYVDRIDNAGAIFVGAYSPEALGDYYAGPNHTLPTSGTAKFSSPLGVDDFIKKTSYIKYNKDGLRAVKDKIIRIASDEGLIGHANSISIRFGGQDD